MWPFTFATRMIHQQIFTIRDMPRISRYLLHLLFWIWLAGCAQRAALAQTRPDFKADMQRLTAKSSTPSDKKAGANLMPILMLLLLDSDPATQSISIAALPDLSIGTAPILLSATVTSGLAVTFSTSTPLVCSVSASTLTVLAAGICTVTAMQAGDANFAAAAVSRSFTVSAAPPAFMSIPFDTGGWFSGFAVHGSGRVYGYGDVFGTWRSDDAGQSWRYLQGGLTIDDNFVSGMAVAAGNADKALFRTASRLWKSLDGGASWSIALADLSGNDLVRGSTPVIFHPGNDNEIWLAAKRNAQTASLWHSVDSGNSWNAVGGSTFTGAALANTIYVRAEFPDQLFVGTQQGLYVSVDGGASWSLVPVPLRADASTQPSVTAIVRRADGIGYFIAAGASGAGFNNSSGGYRLAASNWADPATYTTQRTVFWWDGWAPSNATVLADGSFVSGGDGDQQSSATASDFKGSQRISHDGGLTWTMLESWLVGPTRPSWSLPIVAGSRADGGRDMVVQDPTKPTRWFMTGGSSPVISEDSGTSWQYPPLSSGIAGVMTYKTRFASAQPTVALIPGSDKGVFVVTDGGASGRVAGNSASSLNTLFTAHEAMSVDGVTIVAAGVDQVANVTRIEKTVDGGANWSVLNLTGSGLPASSEGITRALMSAADADDFLVLLGEGGANSNPGMWRTRNGGATFVPVSGLPATLNTGMRYHDENAWLERDGVNTHVRYFASRPHLNLFRSTDGGSTWAATANTPGSWAWIDSVAVDSSSAGRVWVTTAQGLHLSSNGGDSWVTPSSAPGQPVFVSASKVDAAGGRVAVWGKRSGDGWNKLYYSPDNGATWTEKTRPEQRFAWLKALAVDPVVPGKIWVTGISAYVVN